MCVCVCVKGLTDYALMAQIFTFSALHKVVQIATVYCQCYSVDVILAYMYNKQYKGKMVLTKFFPFFQWWNHSKQRWCDTG